MYVKTFAEQVALLAKEIGCDGKGNIGSHSIASSVEIMCENDDDAEYELVGLEASMMGGCGCWMGIDIRIRKKVV